MPVNPYMQIQIDNVRATIQTLRTTIVTAAAMDDGRISRQEKKNIDRIIKAADRYLKDLDAIR